MEVSELDNLAKELMAQHAAQQTQELAQLSETARVYKVMLKIQKAIGDSFGFQMTMPDSYGGHGILLSQSIERPHEPKFYDTSTLHHLGIIITPTGIYESLGFGAAYSHIYSERIPVEGRFSNIRDNSGATLSLFSGTDSELEAVVRQSANVSRR